MANSYPPIAITVASGATVSSEFDIEGAEVVGLELPAAFTSTLISFQVRSYNNPTSQTLYDDLNNLISLIVAQGHSYSLVNIAAALMPWRYAKLVCGSAEGAARTINISRKG